MLRLLLLTLPLAILAGDVLECRHPYINIGERCIYMDPWQVGTMAEVRAICKTHGGDLIWFDSDTDCDFYRELIETIRNNPTQVKDYWIGVTDEGHEDNWKYMKNNVAVRNGPPFWYQGYPKVSAVANCAYLRKTYYYWFSTACTNKFATLCRK
ncbi:hypothetical protein GWK47_000679 [Chionoecetes opilio]|uniref:C-type lectin domain-containing protein n=1 Tax=Chionoecetes opilio TaxID=41210 RepID=A0A8J4YBI1_CHIOP|nr:hypothetical protein GWK47_000679 [Chionoecetes opilio]